MRIDGGSPKPGARVARRSIAGMGVSVYSAAFSKNVRISSRMGAASSTRMTDRTLEMSQSPRPGPQTMPSTLRGPSGTSTNAPSIAPPSGAL